LFFSTTFFITQHMDMKIIQRMKQPTPSFFRKVRNAGLALVSISGAILAAPVALPALVVTIAGYVTVAGTVAATVSQAVTETGSETPGDERE
jgi:hypothetical protein